MSKNPLCKKTSYTLVRKLITSNVGSSPDTSLGAYGPWNASGHSDLAKSAPPFSVINSYLSWIGSIDYRGVDCGVIDCRGLV